MEKMKAGFIGYMQKGDDYFKVLETYAGFGFTMCENSWPMFMLEGDLKDNLKRVHDMGISFFTIGGRLDGDAGEMAEKARSIGADSVTIYHSQATSYRFADRAELPDYDESMREIDRFEALAAALDKEGMYLNFHNHDQEFLTCYQGAPLFWHMVTKAPHLKFELDVGWVNYAGEDPAKIIRQLGERIKILHIKDYARGEMYEEKPIRKVTVPRYTTPGTGFVDLEACLQAGLETGVKYAVIEQDRQYNLTMEESVRTAYFNMKETGCVV